MKPENKTFLRYTFFVFVAALIAYTFLFIFAVAWKRPLGYNPFTDFYFYGFIFYLPLWMAALMFANLVLKISIHRKVTVTLEVLLFGLLLAPVVFAKVIVYYDYVALPFYAVDFFLSLSLLALFRRKFVKE